MDYGRYRYEQTKKKQEAKKKQSTFQLKEIKVRPKTGKKDKVKVTVIFRGREITLSELGRKVLDRIIEETEEIAVVEQSPKFEGRILVMVLSPK